ncbi:hypothetical protein MPPM_0506 [Methylorubrum populi]|uniref:Uncharacterized protein n=1 Tax=Methylorubrum populi TaxID=223967 RepID=A0A160PCH8_9HYPH|nr:hypothetical protein [Methylorubrum populi]BAU89111.1 hypothetical protein MPPM_0506 [Methylorubrum populi]
MKPSPLTRHLAGGLAAYALLVGAAAAQDAAPVAPPAPQAASGKPANLCQELVAFVKQPEPSNKAATTPAQQATAVSNPSGKTEGGKPSDGGEPQKTSGLSGAVAETGNGPASGKQTGNPSSNQSGNPAVNPHAKANAEAKNPPPPAAPAPAPKPDPAIVEKIEAAAGANDLAACRDAARAMRVAGVVMPPPLLALAALDLKFFQQ